jgi:hypothetical protein
MLTKLLFYRQTFEKYSSIKFRENPSSCRRVVSWGRTDGHGETNIRVSLYCERAVKMEETFHEFLQMHFVPFSAVGALIVVRSHLFLILNMTFDTPLFPYTSFSLFVHYSCSNQSFDFFAYSQKWLPASFPSVRPAPTEQSSVKFGNGDI